LYALAAAVEGVAISDGKVPPAVLLELLADLGPGTLMRRCPGSTRRPSSAHPRTDARKQDTSTPRARCPYGRAPPANNVCRRLPRPAPLARCARGRPPSAARRASRALP